ncbi:MAG: ThiF family adenylyltransferase [Pseudobdellovibrionaceae bacterium]
MDTENTNPAFDPEVAFSRTLGWLTVKEQQRLASVKIGLVGLGGVGGQYAEVLARLGVGHFVIYDPDTFSIENTNRQNECRTSNYGKSKAKVIGDLIRDINPMAQVTAVPKALEISEVDAFCRSIDIYIDSLDFFVVDLRIAIFRKMRELGKPAFTIAPIGSGAASLLFTKDSMSFDDYFGFHRTTDPVIRSNMFLVGVAPTLQHRHYMPEPDRIDFTTRKAPSLPAGVYSCAAVAVTLVMKLTLQRGKILATPWSIHSDPYLFTNKKRYIWLGYRNPFQQLKLFVLNILVKKLIARKAKEGQA